MVGIVLYGDGDEVSFVKDKGETNMSDTKTKMNNAKILKLDPGIGTIVVIVRVIVGNVNRVTVGGGGGVG